MGMKKTIILGLLLILSISVVSALDFEAEVKPSSNELFLYEDFVEFNITVTNNKDSSDYFGISLTHPYWYITTVSGIIPGHSSESWVIKVRPKENADPRIYALNFEVKSRDEEASVKLPVSINYKSFLDPKDYVPMVKLIVSDPGSIVPNEEIPLYLNIRNRNPLDIPSATLKISSTIGGAEEEISLAPLEEKNLIIPINFDPLALGNYPLKVELIYDGRTVAEHDLLLEIKQYSSIKREVETKNKIFGLKKVEIINLTNEGNVKRTADIDRKTSFWTRLFSYSDHKSSFEKVDGEGFVVWEVQLAPYESTVIKFTTNYFWFILIILLGIIYYIAYLKYRSPVVLNKESKVLETQNEGISVMKVVIYLKNRANKPLTDIVILDKVPAIADLMIDHSTGIVQPAKVTNDKTKGSLLRWEIEALDPYEERILTYKLKSKLGIVGDMKLPPVKAKFMSEEGQERVYISK